jgi:hypothetical protein
VLDHAEFAAASPARIATTSILDTIDHQQLFAPWFRKPSTWFAWRVFLSALFGLNTGDGDLALFQSCTGLDAPPSDGVTEAWLVCGRRAGKSFILALIAVYLAIFRDWSEYLAPGERGTIKVLACDRKQARVIHRYSRALLTKVPAIAGLVERDGDDEIDLSNGITIEIQTSSFRSVRGYTLIAALCDEIAFWRSDESANPDTEILAALRPAMSTVPLSKSRLLIARASPQGGCFSNPEAASVGTDLSAVYRDDSRGDHPRVTRHRGNCCRMLDLQRGGHLFRYHAGRFGSG